MSFVIRVCCATRSFTVLHLRHVLHLEGNAPCIPRFRGFLTFLHHIDGIDYPLLINVVLQMCTPSSAHSL